jgi:hypothetical protein
VAAQFVNSIVFGQVPVAGRSRWRGYYDRRADRFRVGGPKKKSRVLEIRGQNGNPDSTNRLFLLAVQRLRI